MKSIVQHNKECCFCGSTKNLERHHIFGGGFRCKSEKFGLTVWLCHSCHNEPPNGVHFNRRRRDKLKRIAQRIVSRQQHWTKEDFVREFGHNYL